MKDFKWFLFTMVLLMIGLLVWMCVEEAYAETYTVCTVEADGGLNVRLGPNVEYKSCALLCDGAEVVVLETRDNWALVNWRSMIGKREPIGWVCSDYLVRKYDIFMEVMK